MSYRPDNCKTKNIVTRFGFNNILMHSTCPFAEAHNKAVREIGATSSIDCLNTVLTSTFSYVNNTKLQFSA